MYSIYVVNHINTLFLLYRAAYTLVQRRGLSAWLTYSFAAASPWCCCMQLCC